MNEKLNLPKATREVVEKIKAIDVYLSKAENQNNADFKSKQEESCTLRESYNFYDEIFEENGKKGLKDAKEDVVVPAIYDEICWRDWYFTRGAYVAVKSNGKMGLVLRDGKGTPASKFEFSRIDYIPCTNVFMVWKEGDDKHFALWYDGEVVTPYDLDAAYDLCDGNVVVEKGGKQGLLYVTEGTLYVTPEYDEIEGSSDATFVFRKDGKEGWVTTEGQFVTEQEFNALEGEEFDKVDAAGFLCGFMMFG